MTTLHIKGGRLVDPGNRVDAKQDVFVRDGKIAALGKAPAGFRAERTIDASNLVVCPGLVDLSARLREPGFEYKATLESEMQAAVAGGVTSLACPPDTDPPLDEPGLVEMLKYRAQNLNLVHVYPLGALTWKLEGERLTEMVVLRDAGCVAFSHADTPIPDTQVLWRALQYAATFGIAVWLRPQDGYLERGGVAHDGEVATRRACWGFRFAETIALGTILQLVARARARVHLCRLSTAEGAAMLRAAKAEGLPITCDAGASMRTSRRSTWATSTRIATSSRPCGPCATATRCARRSRMALSTRCARITRPSTRTPSSCRSPSRSPERPGSSSSCRLPSNGRRRRASACPTPSRR